MYLLRAILIGLCVVAMSTAARAGQSAGSVEGTAADTSGARLPGVTVEVVLNAAVSRPVANTTTDASGFYRFASLRPGEYIIRFRLEGFSTAESPVHVTAGQTTTAAVTLDVAG